MNIDSLIINLKNEEFIKTLQMMLRKDLTQHAMTDRPFLIGKIKIIGLIKEELGVKIMTEFVGPRLKIFSYLIDDGSYDKKAKGTRKCIIKRRLKIDVITKY